MPAHVPFSFESSTSESILIKFLEKERKTLETQCDGLGEIIRTLRSSDNKSKHSLNALLAIQKQVGLGHRIEAQLLKKWMNFFGQRQIPRATQLFNVAKADDLQNLCKRLDEVLETVDRNRYKELESPVQEAFIEEFESAYNAHTAFNDLVENLKNFPKRLEAKEIEILGNYHNELLKTIERLGQLTPRTPRGNLRSAGTRPITPGGNQNTPLEETIKTPESGGGELKGSGAGSPATPSSAQLRDARRRVSQHSRKVSDGSQSAPDISPELKEKDDKIAALVGECKTICTTLDSYKKAFGKSTNENKELKHRVDKLNKQLAEYEGELDQLKKEKKGMLEKQLEISKKEKSTLFACAKKMEEERECWEAKHALSEEQIKKLEQSNRQYREQNKDQSKELTESSSALKKREAQDKTAALNIALMAQSLTNLTGEIIPVDGDDPYKTLARLPSTIEKARNAYQAKKENDQRVFNNTSALQEKLKCAIEGIESITLQQQADIEAGNIDGAFQTRVSMVSAKRLNQMAQALAKLSEVVSEISPRLKVLENKQSNLESARITEVKRDRYTCSPRPSPRASLDGIVSPVPLRLSQTQSDLANISRRASIESSSSLRSPSLPSFSSSSFSSYSVYSDNTDVTIPDEESYAIKSKCEALKQKCLDLAERISEEEGERLALEEQFHALANGVGQLKENTDYLHQKLIQLDNGFIQLERMYILTELKLLVEYVANHAYQFFSFNIAQEIFEDLRVQCKQYLLENSEDSLNTPRAIDLFKTLDVAQKMLKDSYAVLPFRFKVTADDEVPRGQILDIFRAAGHFEWVENSHYSLDISHEKPTHGKEKAVLQFSYEKESSKAIEAASELEREEFVLSVAYAILDAAEKDRENTPQSKKDKRFTVTLEGDTKTVRQLAEYLQVGLTFYDKLCLTGKKPNIIINTPQLEVPRLSEEKLKSMSKRALRGIRLDSIPHVTCAAELNNADYSATPSCAASAVG